MSNALMTSTPNTPWCMNGAISVRTNMSDVRLVNGSTLPLGRTKVSRTATGTSSRLAVSIEELLTSSVALTLTQNLWPGN